MHEVRGLSNRLEVMCMNSAGLRHRSIEIRDPRGAAGGVRCLYTRDLLFSTFWIVASAPGSCCSSRVCLNTSTPNIDITVVPPRDNLFIDASFSNTSKAKLP